jgi:hypothetical protein
VTTLVYPYKAAYDDGVELRYSLRSVAQHFHPSDGVLDLLIAGDRPSWLNDTASFIPVTTTENKSYNIAEKVSAACRALDDGPAVYCDDDFFLLEPVSSIALGHQRFSIFQHVSKVRREEPGSWYCLDVEATARYLDGGGWENTHSWEIHRPFPIVPSDVVEALRPIVEAESAPVVPLWRTVYGVTLKDTGWPMDDPWTAKGYKPWGNSWISLGDGAWVDYGRRLSKWFPVPSPWEKS